MEWVSFRYENIIIGKFIARPRISRKNEIPAQHHVFMCGQLKLRFINIHCKTSVN